jgi:erythromycin esterase-like protein
MRNDVVKSFIVSLNDESESRHGRAADFFSFDMTSAQSANARLRAVGLAGRPWA